MRTLCVRRERISPAPLTPTQYNRYLKKRPLWTTGGWADVWLGLKKLGTTAVGMAGIRRVVDGWTPRKFVDGDAVPLWLRMNRAVAGQDADSLRNIATDKVAHTLSGELRQARKAGRVPLDWEAEVHGAKLGHVRVFAVAEKQYQFAQCTVSIDATQTVTPRGKVGQQRTAVITEDVVLERPLFGDNTVWRMAGKLNPEAPNGAPPVA